MKKPNVLIILTDQLRRDALNCYGDQNIRTPNIDAIASSGVRFTQACSTYPICVPFRFTFITGHYAHSRQVPGIDWRMSPSERTMADEFNEDGYDSIYVGKWHLYGGHGPRAFKTPVPREHQGRWRKWFGFELRNSFFDTCYFEDDDPTPHEIDGYQTDGLFDKTIDYLKGRKSDKPFVCVLSVEAPHPPMQAPEEFLEQWENRDIELPPNFMLESEIDHDASGWSRVMCDDDRENLTRNRRIYYAMIANLDWNVGKIMAYLQSAGIADDTVVLFTSDHGELGGSHCLDGKQYPFEESVGIPLIVSGPGIPAGRTVDEPISTEDLFPTVLGLANITPQEHMYGKDLCPIMTMQTSSLDRPGIMLEFVRELRPQASFHTKVWRGFRSIRYKYTAWGMSEGMKPWQFFDLKEDPYELNNLVHDPAMEDVIRQHHQWLRDRMIETGDEEWLASAWDLEELNPWVIKG